MVTTPPDPTPLSAHPSLPLLFLPLFSLQFLQIFLGQIDDIIGLLAWVGPQQGWRERSRTSKERRAGGCSRQVPPQVLIDGFALEKFCSETHTHKIQRSVILMTVNIHFIFLHEIT